MKNLHWGSKNGEYEPNFVLITNGVDSYEGGTLNAQISTGSPLHYSDWACGGFLGITV